MTITLDEEIYDGLVRVVGRRKISRFLGELARPHVMNDDMEIAYREMAADQQREKEASEWCEGLIRDVADASR
jgi:predicted CopG family antitoxin